MLRFQFMNFEARFEDGTFRPLGDVRDLVPGKVYQVFSDEEIRSLTEDLAWLRTAELRRAFKSQRRIYVADRIVVRERVVEDNQTHSDARVHRVPVRTPVAACDAGLLPQMPTLCGAASVRQTDAQ